MLAFCCFGDLKASLIYTNGVCSDVKVMAVQNGVSMQITPSNGNLGS
jgi:hypothetical protein